jgi:hypothetical protein
MVFEVMVIMELALHAEDIKLRLVSPDLVCSPG